MLLTLSLTSSYVNGVDLVDFYPFGDNNGDDNVFPNDDASSLPINLPVPFPFFDIDRDTVFVSVTAAW